MRTSPSDKQMFGEKVVDVTSEKQEGGKEVEVGNFNEQGSGEQFGDDDVHVKYEKWAMNKMREHIVEEERAARECEERQIAIVESKEGVGTKKITWRQV